MRWAGHVARMGRMEMYIGFLREGGFIVHWRTWEDNIKVDLKQRQFVCSPPNNFEND